MTKKRRARTKFQRRLAGLLALAIALLGVGTLYSFLVPEPQTAQAQEDPAVVRQGEQIYNNTCITCHGANLEGVEGPRAEPGRRSARRRSTSRPPPAGCRP